jgi:hypothetical protein
LGHSFITHFSGFTVGLISGLNDPAMFKDAPTGQIFLHQYLFSLKLARIATAGIADSSMMMGIILPVMLVKALR